jgi:two-component system, chemotaxis family, sensor kinase CheA
MSDVDTEILDVFRAEANERLDRMVELLVGIEDGSAPVDAIDLLFRDVHSVKGSAGMVGYDGTRTTAHALEDRLSEARDGDSLPSDLVEPLLLLTDAVRRSLGGDGTAASGPGPTVNEPTAAPAQSGATRTIRMPAEKVDRLLDAVGESVLQMRTIEQVLDLSHDDGTAEWELDRGKVLLDALQRAAIDMRTLPLASIVGPYPRAVRELALAEGKEVALETRGMEAQLDRVILDGIADAISHMLSNAVAHGIESPEDRERAGKRRCGRIVLRAEQRGSLVAVEVSDDGRGVAPEVLARADASGSSLVGVLCTAGFSTAATVSEVAGRGVGLDAVKAHVESLGGSIEIQSTPGAGTTTTLLLPYSVALTRVLLIERDGHHFAIPLASVEEVAVVENPLSLLGRQSLELHGRAVPLGDLAALLGAPARALGRRPRAVVVRSSEGRRGIVCDRVLGDDEVMVKGLGALLANVPGYLGAAIVDNGAIAPVLDPAFLTRSIDTVSPALSPHGGNEPKTPKVLVVDDQFTVRELQRSILEAAGYRVTTARNGREACAEIAADAEIDLVVTDVQMPEMDGIELLRTIRADPQRSSLPVVVLTSLAREDDKHRGAEAGADAYIVKDEFDQRALLDTVERLVAR